MNNAFKVKKSLLINASGSIALDIQGNSGQLFSVEDSLTGSLMSVNDISGLPILEVFDDDRVVMGTFGANTLVVSGSNVGIGTTSPATKLDVSGAIRTSTGILFGADTAAANTLDDYEEGTWTPTIVTGGFTSLTIERATYTKIGNRVYIVFNGFLVGTGNASNLVLAGLPFAVITNGWVGGSNYFQKLNTEFDIIAPLAISNSSTIVFQIVDTNGDGGNAKGSSIGAGYVNISLFYETT